MKFFQKYADLMFMVEVMSPNCVICWSGLCKCNLKVDIKKRKNRRKKNLNIFIACVPTTMLLIFMPSHSILLGSNESHFAFTLSIWKLLKILTKNKQRTWMAITIQTFFFRSDRKSIFLYPWSCYYIFCYFCCIFCLHICKESIFL